MFREWETEKEREKRDASKCCWICIFLSLPFFACTGWKRLETLVQQNKNGIRQNWFSLAFVFVAANIKLVDSVQQKKYWIDKMNFKFLIDRKFWLNFQFSSILFLELSCLILLWTQSLNFSWKTSQVATTKATHKNCQIILCTTICEESAKERKSLKDLLLGSSSVKKGANVFYLDNAEGFIVLAIVVRHCLRCWEIWDKIDSTERSVVLILSRGLRGMLTFFYLIWGESSSASER